MESRILAAIEEQVAVKFTGKVNILASYNRQFLGHILFINGEVIQVFFNKHRGLKAFYNLLIQERTLQSFDYVVEPELVEEKDRQIHYPFAVLKNKLGEVLKKYKESLKSRPPNDIKIIVDANFLKSKEPITPEEFDVLSTLSDWSGPKELYDHCDLLDHEITMALVSLRKKKALKILAPRQE